MDFGVDEQQRLGIGLALAGAGSLLAVSPALVPVPQRPALYSGTALLAVGVLLVILANLSE